MDERRFRKPMRYRGHDYRAPCSVHITICTWNRQHLFGAVTEASMALNDAGTFIASTLPGLHTPDQGVELDTHLVMPDHLHAILHLGTQPFVNTAVSIPQLVHDYKLRVVRSWPRGIRQRSWPPYEQHLWQKTYYDTRIRNDRHLEATREYIIDNPRRWRERRESPET